MVAISLVGFQVWSQEQKAKPLYETFDNQFGKQNLGINNGTIHINNDRSNNMLWAMLLMTNNPMPTSSSNTTSIWMWLWQK